MKKILAIETSCDDTGIALIKKNKGIKVLFNLVSSQTKLHQKYGGVYPLLAKREHKKNLPLLFKKVSKQTKDVKAIAVTVGPGLDPCLWTGINFAKDLAEKFKVPLLPVNHIEAHIFASLLRKPKFELPKKTFPAIALIVSGGHTQLILVKALAKYQILGETRDDAAGECFDKTARILGLSYPGGPAIEKQASKAKEKMISLPRPMISQNNYDFSFSGLKTAVLYDFKKRNRKPKTYIQSIAKEIQDAIIDVLLRKTIKAVKDYRVKSLILGGGVSANKQLRERFRQKIKKEKLAIKFFVPEPEHSTDNALMTALAASYYFSLKKFKNPDQIKSEPNLSIKDRLF